MRPVARTLAVLVLAAAATAGGLTGCGSSSVHFVGSPAASSARSDATPSGPASASPAPPSPTPKPSASPSPSPTKVSTATNGNPHGGASIPAGARPVDTSHPAHVIGTGTPAGCTSAAVVKAVGEGGVITFNCGAAPVTITMGATAKVVNSHPNIVIDGGGRVTLSGAGARRILYMDTCDRAQTWTTSHCDNQSTPTLTVQNITFSHGNSIGQLQEGGGGGAIFDRGGRLKVVNSRFTDNTCDPTGPDLGGAAIRALSQYNNDPVYIVDSTFTGGRCSNGGALSSIGVSWDVINCLMTGNTAIGNGANPATKGTPGGGSGGAIYTDGNTYTLTVAGTIIKTNSANEGGGAIFYVSNDHSGTLAVHDSTLSHNHSGQFQNYPGIFFLGKGKPSFSGSSVS